MNLDICPVCSNPVRRIGDVGHVKLRCMNLQCRFDAEAFVPREEAVMEARMRYDNAAYAPLLPPRVVPKPFRINDAVPTHESSTMRLEPDEHTATISGVLPKTSPYAVSDRAIEMLSTEGKDTVVWDPARGLRGEWVPAKPTVLQPANQSRAAPTVQGVLTPKIRAQRPQDPMVRYPAGAKILHLESGHVFVDRDGLAEWNERLHMRIDNLFVICSWWRNKEHCTRWTLVEVQWHNSAVRVISHTSGADWMFTMQEFIEQFELCERQA